MLIHVPATSNTTEFNITDVTATQFRLYWSTPISCKNNNFYYTVSYMCIGYLLINLCYCIAEILVVIILDESVL